MIGQFISEKQIKEKDGPRGRESAQKKKKKKDKKQPCCSEATSTAQRKKKRIHGCLSPNSIRFLFSPSKKMMATRSRPSSKDDPRWLISVQVHNLSVDTELGNGGSATVKVHLWILPADSEPTESAGDAIHMTSKRKSPTLRVSPSGMSEPRTWRLSSSQIWRFSGDGDTPLRIQRLVLLTLTPTCC
jgi:hypothetical protein